MQKRMKYFKIILIIFSLVLNSIKFIPTANSQDIISTEIISSDEIEFNSDLSTEFEPSIDPIDNLNKLSEDLQEEKNLHNNADIEDSECRCVNSKL